MSDKVKFDVEINKKFSDNIIINYGIVNVEKIKNDAQIDPYQYDGNYVNCLTVARLSSEKD